MSSFFRKVFSETNCKFNRSTVINIYSISFNFLEGYP